LLVGQLLFAGLDARMVVRTDEAPPRRRAPRAVRAGLGERIPHRGQLIGHRTSGGLVDLGVLEIVLRDLEKPRRNGAAGWRGVAGPAATGAGEYREDHGEEPNERGASHPTVFDSAPVHVKAV